MSSLSGGQAEETTNRPEGIRKDQNETSLTVPSLSANGSQLAIPVTEEPRAISPVRHNSRHIVYNGREHTTTSGYRGI